MATLKINESSKLSLQQYVWFGFNFVFGITFVSTFAVFVNGSQANLGLNMLWIWVLEGAIAGICALSFAKLSRHHHVESGAAYIYTRSTFGRTTGLLVGLVQYVYLPFSLTYQLMSFMRGIFSVDFVAGTPWYAIYFGSFTDITLDVISIVVFGLCAATVFFGMKFYKKLTHASAVVKWAAFSFLIVFAIVLATQHGTENLQHWKNDSTLTLDGFVRTFNSCFFCFVGFELFSTSGRNVQNAQKNVGKGIIIVIVVSTFLFILLTLLFFTAFQHVEQNFNMDIWSSSGVNISVILYGGPIITMVSIIFMRVNSVIQKSLYGGTTLQPLAYEGFISNRFAKLTKEGVPKNASKLNLLITLAVALIWLVVPDLIKGCTLTSEYGLMPSVHDYQKYNNIFNMSSFTSFASIIAIFVYIMVMLATIKLILSHKVKANTIEMIAYFLDFICLVFFFGYHYYDVIVNQLIHSKNVSKISGGCIELACTFLVIMFFVVWYRFYYRKKLQTRIITNPQLQKQLDNEFHLI